MKKEEIIQQTKSYVKNKLDGEGSGHDWWHIHRVWKNALHIGEKENADLFIVQLAALLHDIADFKFHHGDSSVGPRIAGGYLESLGVEENIISHVCGIIKNLSFKGAGAEVEMTTLEGKVVRDADRLDALGAIGIARCFTYGGYKGTPIHIPGIEPMPHKTADEYIKRQSTQINHFYEKLLLLKDLMCTETGKQLAQERHKFMEQYLERFFREWDGEL